VIDAGVPALPPGVSERDLVKDKIAEEVVDDRLFIPDRMKKVKRALNFSEAGGTLSISEALMKQRMIALVHFVIQSFRLRSHPFSLGKYVQIADEIRIKEEKKMMAGFASGRKAPEVIDEQKLVAETPQGMHYK
jgi:hypothetical protein